MEKIHIIGIGGIGISALARYYLSEGARVSGSDITPSDLIDELIREGIIFSPGHASEHIPRDVTRVIYTAAVKRGNPELVAARKVGCPVETYAQTLGKLTKKYKTIAVSGS